MGKWRDRKEWREKWDGRPTEEGKMGIFRSRFKTIKWPCEIIKGKK